MKFNDAKKFKCLQFNLFKSCGIGDILWVAIRLIYLSAVDVLDGTLPEEEVNKFVCFKGTYEVGLAEPHAVVLTGAQGVDVAHAPRDDRVGSRKIGGGGREKSAVLCH